MFFTRWFKSGWLLILLCLGAAAPAAAQYRFDHWTADNGLPQNSVRDILQTQDGYLWFTTFDGLVRFDGVRFTVFNKNNSPGLPGNRFVQLFEDRSGDLWAGLETGEVVRRRQGRFTTYTQTQGLPGDLLPRLADDGQGNVAIYYEQYSIDEQRKVYTGVSLRVYRWSEGRFQPAEELSSTFSGPSVLAEETNRVKSNRGFEGDYWVSTPLRVIHLMKGGGIQVYSEGNGLPGTQPGLIWGKQRPMQAVSRDGAGRLWLTELKSGQSQLLSLQTPEGFDVFGGYADNEGNYWFSTNGSGLFRARRQTVTPFGKAQGLNFSEVYPLLESRDGGLWVGAYGEGVFRFRDGAFTQYPGPKNRDIDSFGGFVSSLYEDRVLKKLGVGGMGEVYLAEDLNLGRQVAVKVLSHELTDNPEHLRRFEREARAASALNHPNILTVYEIGEADGAHFIATEFIEGESLSQRMERGAMGLAEVLDIGIQIASALAAAHEARIVHRDIKRDNIMVREDHLVKVLDFGLAKLVQQEAHQLDSEGITKALHKTTPGVVMGTAEYMSPEQARGHEVDERTDIWSLGVVLYRMVTGNTPFKGETMSDVIASILKTDPPPLVNEAEPVPRELEQIISKALRKNREDRYQHIKDLLIDLKDCKQELEFSSRLGASVPRDQRSWLFTRSAEIETSVVTDVHSTSRVQYIVNKIKRNKLGVAAALVVLIGLVTIGALAYLRYFAAADQTGIDSLAVMPFVNDTGDSEMEYISDGLSESLINNLSQLPGLKVIARSSAFRYKGKNTSAEEVAHALGVKSILTGRVLRYGENLQISVELMDARDKAQVWGGQYNRSGRDLMAVQREIAQDISRNLRLKLSSLQQSRVGNLHTSNSEAYELYLKGRFYWNKRTGESLKKSLDYFNQSIEKDPSYALAYVGLADAYIVIPYFSVGTAQDSYPKAKAAARRALEIDDRLAEAHTAMAAVLMNYDWNLPESNREFERAIELNPNYATAHHWYARENLTIMGQFDKALAEMRRAQELDPLSLIINANLGKAYFNARRYDEAIQQLRKTVEIDQSFFVAHHYLGSAYAIKGNFSEALAEYQKARQLNPDDPHVVALLARLYAVSGKRDEALRTLAQLKSMARERYVADYSIALVYAGLGEKDQAFALLEKSYQDHTVDMLTLYYDPLIDNLRSDPRLADLARRVGLQFR